MSAPITDIEEARAALAAAEGVLIDWDGCLAFGNRISPEAKRFLIAQRDRTAIISNNSTELPEDFAQWLAEEGVRPQVRRIILAGAETIRQLAATSRDRKILLFASERLRAYARGLGLSLAKTDASQVALLRDTHFSYAKLARAVAAIENGAGLIVSNGDAAHPGRETRIPETGALLAALKTAASMDDDAIEIIGKPAPLLFELGAKSL
ncbi:MAG: hypothetical protein RIE56_12490, partial [Amphiplicatus sp.]